MSATNRGGKRRDRDQYQTPVEVAEIVLDYLLTNSRPAMRIRRVIEPCAGQGNIVNAVRKHLPHVEITVIDIDPVVNSIQGADNAVCADVLEYEFGEIAPWTDDLIISNPPYGQAELIIRHCLAHRERHKYVCVAMLLRLAFLESQQRKPFWDEYPVSDLLVLSKRPSFTGGGTDATAYAWFIWRPAFWRNGYMQQITVV